MVLLHLLLEDHHRCSIGFRSGDILGHSITFSFLSKAVVILTVRLGSLSCHSAQFLKGGHHVLLQNVTVHVGIHVSLNKAQLPSTRSTHAAPDHDATSTMVDCRQDTIFAGHHLSQTSLSYGAFTSVIRLIWSGLRPKNDTLYHFQAFWFLFTPH